MVNIIIGTPDPDLLLGTSEDDEIQGLAGDDTLLGFQGNDTLFAGEGNNLLFGGQGDDYLFGGPGNDTLFGELGDDVIYGGEGNNFILGNAGNDSIVGGSGNDTIYGGQGSDTLIGGEGDDLLFGDRGNDILYTGSGFNTLTGGAGSDLFVIGVGFNGGQTDVITDFRPGFDLIALANGLEFADLEIAQQGNDTLIRDRQTRERLVLLEATDSTILNSGNFTKSITSITSVLEFWEDSVNADENQSLLQIPITRTGSPLDRVGATLVVAGDSTADVIAEIPVIFEPFETFKEFTVSIVDNDTPDGPRPVTLTLADPSGGASIGQRNELIINIQDDEPAPVPPPPPEPTPTPIPELPALNLPSTSQVSLTIEPEAVEEDSGNSLVYTLTRTPDSLGVPLAVDFSVGGTAILGEDYTVSGAVRFDGDRGTAIFDQNATTTQFLITPIANDIFQLDRTIEVVLDDSGFLYIAEIGGNTATGTIIDDDPPPSPPLYDFSDSRFIGVEGDDPNNPEFVEVTIERSFATEAPSRVDVAITPITAEPGRDFEPTPDPTPVMFDVGQTTATVKIELIPNTEPDPTRTANLSFTNFFLESTAGEIEAGQPGRNNPEATLVILDDDGPFSYQFSQSLFTTLEGSDTNVTEVVTVERIGRIREASSVTVELTGITAVPGIDFEPEEITINFQADQISQIVPITIFGNLVSQPNRNLELSLVPAQGELVGEENPRAELIIIDDDDIPTYDFSSSIFEVSEGDGVTETVVVVRGGNISNASSVTVVLEPGPENPATPGVDIVETEVRLEFAPGQEVARVPLEIVDDEIAEPTESIILSFEDFEPRGRAGVTHPTATLLIFDNDSPPTYDFGQSEYEVEEGDERNTTMVVELFRSGDLSSPSSVDVVLTGITATEGDDFVGSVIPIQFAQGETQARVPIEILGNTLVQPDRTLQLDLDDNFVAIVDGEERILGQTGTINPSTVLTILDDDIATVSLQVLTPDAVQSSLDWEQDPPTITRSSNAVLRISREPDNFGDLEITLDLEGNRISLEDYQLEIDGQVIPTDGETAQVTIPDGESRIELELVPLDDDHAEADESLTFRLAESDFYIVDSNDNQGTLTILANGTGVRQLTDSLDTTEEAYFDSIEGSLRQAVINAVNFGGTQKITFLDEAESGTINLVGALPTLNGDIYFDGPGANNLTIQRDPDLTDEFRLFRVNTGTMTFDGLRLANGLAPGTDLDVSVSTTSGSRGGAITIVSTDANVTIIRSLIERNAANNGGAIANSGILNVIDSTIADNQAVNGGGIIIIDGEVNVTNSTIANNSAQIGGGIFNSVADLTLTNSTIVDNTAIASGGGVRNIGGSASLQNTLITNNTAPFGPDAAAAPEFAFNSGGGNLIGDGSDASGLTDGVNGDIIGSADDPVDALISPLANNGGLIPTIALLENSPAINAGNNTFAGGFVNPGEFDSRGLGFPRIVNDTIDIGAFESEF